MANFSYNAVSVTSTATEILPADTTRKGLIIKNVDSTNTIHLGMDTSVTSSNGMPLGPGGTFQMSHKNEMFTGSIYGIGATTDVRFWSWGE